MELISEYQISEVIKFDTIVESINKYDLSVLSEGDLILLEVDTDSAVRRAYKAVKDKVVAGLKFIADGLKKTLERLRKLFSKAKDKEAKDKIKKDMNKARDTAQTKSSTLKAWGVRKIDALKTKFNKAKTSIRHHRGGKLLQKSTKIYQKGNLDKAAKTFVKGAKMLS